MSANEIELVLRLKDEMSAKMRACQDALDEVSEAERGLAKSSDEASEAMRQAEQQAEKNRATMAKLGVDLKQLATVGVGAVSAAFVYSLNQALQMETAMSATEAVVRSTGKAAGLSAEQIADLARAESQLSGLSRDVVQGGENMLLTFTGIRETLPEASRAMQDVAVAMAQGNLSAVDLKATAIQLGKALNDPIAGVSALAEVGVTFTAEQKASIKAMMDMNDTAGAQRIILAELNREFGGMAEAMGNTGAGKIQKAKNALDELSATIGTKALPAVNKLADQLKWALTYEDKLRAATDEHQQAVLKSSASYQEYARIIKETEASIPGMIGVSIRKRHELTQAEYDQQRAAIALAEATAVYRAAEDDAGNAAGRSATQAAELTLAQGSLKKGYDDLALTISGPLSKAIVNNAALTEENSKRAIFAMVSQRAAMDGVTSDELAALTKLGTQWGLVDQKTADALKGMDSALGELAASGNIDLFVARLGGIETAALGAQSALQWLAVPNPADMMGGPRGANNTTTNNTTVNSGGNSSIGAVNVTVQNNAQAALLAAQFKKAQEARIM